MMSTVSTVSTMSTRVSRHCYQASTNQLLNHYDVYNIYGLYSLYKDFQGLLMSREGHRSFYPQTPAHLWTQKLHPLAHIPPGRGSRVFIHRPLHIYRHGNSVHWPVSLQGGAPEFLSTDPCTFTDMETPSVGPYPSREGHRSFY